MPTVQTASDGHPAERAERPGHLGEGHLPVGITDHLHPDHRRSHEAVERQKRQDGLRDAGNAASGDVDDPAMRRLAGDRRGGVVRVADEEVVAVAPFVLIGIFLERYIVKGLTAGAVK